MQHAGLVDQGVGQFVALHDVCHGAPHKALDRADRVLRIIATVRRGIKTNLTTTPFEVTHHRRQDHTTLRIGQALGHAVTHAGDQGVRGAQVNAHRNASLVRVWGLPGFRDL